MSAQHDPHLRPADERDFTTMHDIINSAAEAYRGVIPEDCWHEPYMSSAELCAEIAAGTVFALAEVNGVAVGIMGLQRVMNVELIRHAYVRPAVQGAGIGARLLRHLTDAVASPVLVGTWTAATWAVRFYERHGFERVPTSMQEALLKTYWTISSRQIETSVVLARPALTVRTARDLIAGASAGG